MSSTQTLKEVIANSGYKIRFVAEQIGLTYQGFVNKINDTSRFRANEIAQICELLKIDDEARNKIFFADYVDVQSTIKNESEE